MSFRKLKEACRFKWSFKMSLKSFRMFLMSLYELLVVTEEVVVSSY